LGKKGNFPGKKGNSQEIKEFPLLLKLGNSWEFGKQK